MSISFRYRSLFFLALLGIVFLGFYKTYFIALPHYLGSISWQTHFHASLGIAWVLLLTVQASLVQSGQQELHKKLGLAGFMLFPLFLLSALPMLFYTWLKGDRVLMYAALSDMALLLLFFVCGMAARRKNTAFHRRYMAATGLVLLDPTLARMAVNLLGLPGGWGNHLPFLTIDLVLLVLIFFDWKMRQNWKPWVVAFGCFLIYQAGAYHLSAGSAAPVSNFSSMDLAKIENSEITAWQDLFAAQPESFRQEQGAGSAVVDGVSLFTCKKIPFTHFNVALDLGVKQPFTEATLDAILRHFHSEGISQFYLQHTPVTQPQNAPEWFKRRGMRHVSSWHRIARGNEPLAKALPISGNYTVEEVSAENAEAWAQFIDDVYGMPTKKWLLELPGRPGWTHVICREAGKIVAARSMKINPDGTAYFMIDAPVPGIMTQNFEADYLLARRLVEIGLVNGVQLFTSDIEKPSTTQDTPAYRYWSALGFRVAYEKRNFMF